MAGVGGPALPRAGAVTAGCAPMCAWAIVSSFAMVSGWPL